MLNAMCARSEEDFDRELDVGAAHGAGAEIRLDRMGAGLTRAAMAAREEGELGLCIHAYSALVRAQR